MTTQTPKEMAEAAALACLESLQAALKKEVELRELLRSARADNITSVAIQREGEVRDAEKRSNAAFTAWRKAQEAIPHG